MAIVAWEKSLWNKEPRTHDLATRQKAESRFPFYPNQKKWLQSDHAYDRFSLRTALGVAKDGHVLSSEFKQQVVCICGEMSPSCQHLTWHCNLQNYAHVLRAPQNDGEQCLLVPTVLYPPMASERNVDSDSTALKHHLETCMVDTRKIVATDGSSGGVHWRQASWAVAVAKLFRVGWSWCLAQTAASAELYVACSLATASSKAMQWMI